MNTLNLDLRQYLYSGFWKVLDWIYPPVCASCGEPGYRLCPDCYEKIQFLQGNKCQICGRIINETATQCVTCQTEPPPYDGFRSLGFYEGVIRDCVHALKYENNQSLGDFFSQMLVSLISKENWQLDMVTPVPLSAQRYRERGYNQSSLLAKPLAARLKVKFNPFAVRRIRHTPSQVGLSAEERRQNVIGAFQAENALVYRKSVLLVDDVMTTGATMTACAQAVRDAGARPVYCVTLARHLPRNP